MLPIRDTVPGRNPPVATWMFVLTSGEAAEKIEGHEADGPHPFFVRRGRSYRRPSRDEYEIEAPWLPYRHWRETS